MFCKRCGKLITENSNFCSSCGFSNNYNFSKKTDTQNPDWIKKRNKVLLGIFIFLVFVVITSVDSVRQESINESINQNNSAIDEMDKNGNTSLAIDKLNKSISNDDLDTENRINSLKNLGLAYLSENNEIDALKSFQEALKICDYNSFNYYWLSGEINSINKLPGAALSDYKKAYEIDSNNFQINNSLGLFYLDSEELWPEYKNYNLALNYNKKAYELNQDSDIMKENLSLNYLALKMYDDSLDLLLKTNLESKSENNYYIGLIYSLKDNTVSAKRYFQKAIDLELSENIDKDSYDKVVNYINNIN